MVKKFLKMLINMSMIFLVALITSCNASLSPNISFKKYIDSDPIETENFELKLSSFNEYDINENGYVMMTFVITNKTYSTQTYNIKNLEIVKENTDAIYNVDLDKDAIIIEAEMSASFQILKSLPSSLQKDKYRLNFDLNQYKVTYFLYEIPDELREEIKVDYFIGDRLVYSTVNKHKRPIHDFFVYESSDNLKYCDTWYIDKNCLKKFDINTKIEENLNLYGKEEPMIKWSGFTNDKYSYLSGINHVPSNGVLIIPEKNQNKELAISNYAIKDVNLKKIYVPNTVRIIYSNNFKNINNATIYYDGTEEEWKSLFFNSSYVVTTNVVYNTKYQG